MFFYDKFIIYILIYHLNGNKDKDNKDEQFKICCVKCFQAWLNALEEHSAYSTHYCPPDQTSVGEEEEEEGGMSLQELSNSLQVPEN